MTPADLAPLAHWTLAAKHRILWRLFLTAALTLCFTILLFRSNAEDPRKNYIESQKAVLAMAPPPIPDVENAAVDYRNAFKLFVPGSRTDDPEGNLDREGPFFQTPLVAA